MSPEQIMRQDVTAQTDIYSLGIILYQLLTGTLPFDAPKITEVLQMQVQRTAAPAAKYPPRSAVYAERRPAASHVEESRRCVMPTRKVWRMPSGWPCSAAKKLAAGGAAASIRPELEAPETTNLTFEAMGISDTPLKTPEFEVPEEYQTLDFRRPAGTAKSLQRSAGL